MKIDLAIHASDSNPFYLDFWPIVSKLWAEVFQIRPLLVYIDENHDIPIDSTYGDVLKLKPIEGIPLYLQCLWVRYWIPSQFPDKVSMICDIDMLPVSRQYFIDQIRSIPDDKYVHLNPNHQFIPSCYHIAKGSLYKKVLQLHDMWEDSIRYLHNKQMGHDCFDGTNPILKDKIHWGADEELGSILIRGYPDQSIFVNIPRTLSRIDRIDWRYDPLGIARGQYADAHCVRPLSITKNRFLVEKLVSEIQRYA
jgi:hypothetical protein